MSVAIEQLAGGPLRSERFRHEALLYAGDEQFVDACASFVRAGVDAGEPTLVVAIAQKLDRLRDALGTYADQVSFVDMADVGQNPAHIIPAWQEFVEQHAAPGVRLRGIGEPIFPERDLHALVECERHEALLNIAFADAERFWLLCPYDTEALPAEVIEEARRNHPFVVHDERHEHSNVYRGTEAIAAPFDAELPELAGEVVELRFDDGSLGSVRQFVAEQCALAELSRNRIREVVLAVNEIATNSIKYGGGEGVLRIWSEPGRLVCEIRDRGRLDDPLADRRLPSPDNPSGRGFWLANQLCNLVQVRSFPGEMAVRLHVVRDAAR
jgi:anti-sigma regulatory factor (Ser/Thr protein kinase)